MNAALKNKIVPLCVAMLAAAHVWAGEPKRLVTLAPSHTEILVDLGAADRLVGVSDAEDEGVFPRLPHVGGIQPNWEALVSLKPDLVLADSCHRRFEKTFNRLRIPAVFLPATDAATVDEVFDIIRRIGQITGRSAVAERHIAALRQRLAAAEARIPDGKRPRVYFEIWPKPIQGAARVSLRGDLLRRAKAENILPESNNLTALVSLEWVPRQAPDVIIHPGIVSTAEISARPGWDRIPAIRNGRIYAVDQNRFSRASPNIVRAFEELVDLLYGKAP